MFSFQGWSLSSDQLVTLLRRTESYRTLLIRQIEEEITRLVFPSLTPSDDQLHDFLSSNSIPCDDQSALNDFMSKSSWDLDDLNMFILRPIALSKFSEYRFGPGLEEYYLERKNNLDIVIYSLLRVRDSALARELWIRLSEGEVTFAELASIYSDGPESGTKGIIGPLRLGSIDPGISERLRRLQSGEVAPPELLGNWHVLLRLERLTPSRLDPSTKQDLLREQLTQWIQHRVATILSGEIPDSLDYEPGL